MPNLAKMVRHVETLPLFSFAMVVVSLGLVCASHYDDPPHLRAKRAVQDLEGGESVPSSAFDRGSLVLVPVHPASGRTKRQATEEGEYVNMSNKKYKRLAHSVQVHSDVRFR